MSGRVATLLASLFLLCGCSSPSNEGATIELRGPWPAYEDSVLALDDPLPDRPPFEVRLPVQFGAVALPDGRVLEAHGAYTVLMDVELPRSEEPLGLALKHVWGASSLRCRVDGRQGSTAFTYDLGHPSRVASETRNLQRWGVVPLPPGERMHCRFVLANHRGSPGLREPPRVGRFQALEAERLVDAAIDIGLAGILLAFACVHVVLLLVRHERLYLYFAQVSFALAARQGIAARVYESAFPDSRATDVIWGIDVGSIAFACSGMLAFIGEVVGPHLPVAPRRPLYAFGVALGFSCFARTVGVTSDFFVHASEVYLGVIAMVSLYGLLSALRARDVDDVGLLAFGLGFALATGVYEILAARHLVPQLPLIPVGIVSFVSCQAFLLARRTQRMHVATERLAHELERNNAELARLDEQKDAFVAATSHELKTPLHGMIGLMEGVREQVAGGTRHSIDLAIAAGHRLDTQISGLLDFAKLRRDELVLDRRPIDASVVVLAVVEASRALLGTKPLVLRAENVEAPAPILGDEARVRQVLFQIVGNAIKFTERGTVVVRADACGDRVRIVVKDTGIGIAQENQGRVFDAFTQEAAVDTRAVGGTGLGLAIAKRLVALHGGTIAIASELGAGTTVTIDLPASREVPMSRGEEPSGVESSLLELNSPVAPQESPESSAVFDRRSMQIVLASGARDDRLTVLAVDDDPVNQRVLETQLRPAGYRVVLAGDGVDALEAFRERGPFDLVLLDVMMPRMSGLAALREIRKTASQAELPVILLTAKQQQQDVLAGFDAGANDYLAKPFSKKELLARIETHLTVAKTNQALRRFVPHEFLEALGRKNVMEVKLGDSVERHLAILFGDIRDFTSISEGLGPEETFRFVNECLLRITPLVRESGGFVDKFIGDAVLALFPESTRAAVEAAVAIERSIDAIAVDERRFGFGIGIHVGSTMLGTIGDERRFEATVISDAVNQAARIEGMTKSVGARVLVSGEVAAEIGDAFELRPLGHVRAIGRNEPIAILEVLDADPHELRAAKRAHLDAFAGAIANLRACDYAGALERFASIAKAVPADGVARFFVAAAEDGLAGIEVVREGAVVLNRK